MTGSVDKPYCEGKNCTSREVCSLFERDNSKIGWWILGKSRDQAYSECEEFEEEE